MKPTILQLPRALSCLVLFVFATVCQAGSIQLTPVRVSLSEAAKVQIITVHNTGTEESLMQVSLNKWTLDGTRYAYTPSQDLVITPTTFLLAPGMQQIVRIGLRGSPPVDFEESYRLLIEEVPPPAVAGVTGTRMVLRHDLPVFVAPLVASLASLDFELQCTSAGPVLSVTNIGNVHSQLRSVKLEESANGLPLGGWDTFDYLLPSAQKSWALTQTAPAVGRQNLGVTMLTDQGSFTADVVNSCP